MKNYKTYSISLKPETTYTMARTMAKQYGISFSKMVGYSIFRTWTEEFAKDNPKAARNAFEKMLQETNNNGRL